MRLVPGPFQVLWLGQFVSICGLTVIVPLLPMVLAELGAADDAENRLWTGLSLVAPAVMLSISSPWWGRFGDRWGKKWMVVRALMGIAVSLALMGWAQTPLQLFLARLLQGVCGGVVDATAACAGSMAPEASRGRALGSLNSATAAGSLIGPLIGGVMADGLGFSAVLWGMALLTCLCGLLAAVVLREPKPVGEAERAAEEMTAKQAVRSLITHPRVRNFLIAGMLAQFGVYGLVTVFAPHVESLIASGYAATWVGLLQAATWAAALAASPWWGRRNDRTPVEKNLCAALVLCGLSIGLQVVPAGAEWLIPLRVLQGFCFAALIPAVFLVVTRESEAAHRGVCIGVSQSFLVAGQVAGSLFAALSGGLMTTEWVIVTMGLSITGGGVLLGIGAAAWAAPNKKSVMVKWRLNDDKRTHA